MRFFEFFFWGGGIFEQYRQVNYPMLYEKRIGCTINTILNFCTSLDKVVYAGGKNGYFDILVKYVLELRKTYPNHW